MSSKTRNLYEVLNLSRDCKAEDIKKAFIKLSKEYHPDKNSSNDAHERFVRINEAYTTLSNPLKRKQYDDHLSGRRNYDFNAGRPNKEGADSYRTYGYSSHHHYTHKQDSSNSSYTGSRILFRLTLLPKAVIVTALVLVTFFSSGLELYLFKNGVETRRKMMENESIMASLMLERATRQAKLLGKEEQMKRLQDGKLGTYDTNELVKQYVQAKEAQRLKSK